MPETVLVVGGGPAGLEAARTVAQLGGRAVLVERRDVLGGTPDESHYAALTPNMGSAQEALDILRAGVRDPAIEVHLGSGLSAFAGSAGDFTASVTGADGATTEVKAGAVVVATGFQHFDPGRETQMYGYYEHADVITLPDAEKMLSEHRFVRPSTGEPPRNVAFIQCVGSRDRRLGNDYCSKVCCGVPPKEGSEIRGLPGWKKNGFRSMATRAEPMDPVGTSVPGIFVAGAAAGPKDLEDTMGMAGSAAAEALAGPPPPAGGAAA